MPVKKRRHKSLKDKTDRVKDSKMATVALIFVLLNIFQWAFFVRTELLISSGLSALISFMGLFFAVVAKKKIRKYMGVIQGESRAQLAYYFHLVVGIVSIFFFSWLVLMGVLRGEFI